MLLEIAPATDEGLLPSCAPSLMPFHISYTGPAPISRYFHPRSAPPSLNPLSVRSSSSTTLVAGSSSASIPNENKESLTALSSTSIATVAHAGERRDDEFISTTESSIKVEVVHQTNKTTVVQPPIKTTTETDTETQPATDAIPSDDASDLRWTGARALGSRHVERFIAAFRGRQMYGQAVDIPSGYGGLVLRAPLDSKGKNKEGASTGKPKSKTRVATRRAKRAAVDVAAAEPEEGDHGDCCLDSDVIPTRRLVPFSTFSSFMLWTPDRPLDDGRDEYARALVEWTRLAAEIHCDG